MQAGRSTPWRPGSHDICLVLVGRRWEYWKGEWSPQGWEQRVKGSRIKQGQKTCHTFPAHLPSHIPCSMGLHAHVPV